eukprot:2986987-Pyramimonas_sp.AAC.3
MFHIPPRAPFPAPGVVRPAATFRTGRHRRAFRTTAQPRAVRSRSSAEATACAGSADGAALLQRALTGFCHAALAGRRTHIASDPKSKGAVVTLQTTCRGTVGRLLEPDDYVALASQVRVESTVKPL